MQLEEVISDAYALLRRLLFIKIMIGSLKDMVRQLLSPESCHHHLKNRTQRIDKLEKKSLAWKIH